MNNVIAKVKIDHFPKGYTIRVTDTDGTEYRIALEGVLVGKKIASTRKARKYKHITAIRDSSPVVHKQIEPKSLHRMAMKGRRPQQQKEQQHEQSTQLPRLRRSGRPETYQ